MTKPLAMKKLIFAFLLATSLKAAGPFPYERKYYGLNPYTMIAGSTMIVGMRPLLAFTATVNATTDVFTVTGSTYTPLNGDIVTAETSGTMPGGMDTEQDSLYPNWDVCNASGSTFQLKRDPGNYSPPGPCTGTLLDVSDAGTGTLTLSLFQFNTKLVYFDGDPTGFPAGTTFTRHPTSTR